MAFTAKQTPRSKPKQEHFIQASNNDIIYYALNIHAICSIFAISLIHKMNSIGNKLLLSKYYHFKFKSLMFIISTSFSMLFQWKRYAFIHLMINI